MLQKIFKLFEQIGTARAAAELSKNGHYELAKKMMLENK